MRRRFLRRPAPPPLTLPNNGALLLLWVPLPWRSTAQPVDTNASPMAHYSLAPQAVPTQPTPVLSLGLTSRA